MTWVKSCAADCQARSKAYDDAVQEYDAAQGLDRDEKRERIKMATELARVAMQRESVAMQRERDASVALGLASSELQHATRHKNDMEGALLVAERAVANDKLSQGLCLVISK